jgi:hypothetical protein
MNALRKINSYFMDENAAKIFMDLSGPQSPQIGREIHGIRKNSLRGKIARRHSSDSGKGINSQI